MIRSAILLSTIVFSITCLPAHGNIMGFGDGSGYTLNKFDNGAPSINSGALTLTSASLGSFQAASAFYNTRQSTGSFTASFIYKAVGPADGMTFVIQNDPAGQAALGGYGSGLGYAPEPTDPSKIVNSVGLEVNIYDFTNAGTYLATNGASGIFNYLPVLPVNFYTGDPIKFTITYDATAQTLTETLVDIVLPATSYSHTFTGINIASEVGSSSAYVGFTGGAGGLTSTQTISDFQFQSTVPEPSTLTLLGLGGVALVVWRGLRRPTFRRQAFPG